MCPNLARTAMATATDSTHLRLLQLASMSLPVGGFAFSQGMEYATEQGWLRNSDDVDDWLRLQLQHSFARVDLPIVFRLYRALEDKIEHSKKHSIIYWNDFLLASRETRELRLSDSAMGLALRRLLPTLEVPPPLALSEQPSFVTLFTAAAYHWRIDSRLCALGLAWSWLENQVTAATKLVPLGQSQAQRLLGQMQKNIPLAIDFAESLQDDELGASLPALAIASTLHERQYTRLFRS